jgi:hypothetical protein
MEAIQFSIEVIIRVIVKTVKAKIKSFKTDKLVGKVKDEFSGLKSASFVGIKGYTNSVGEVSNHVVLTNFSYGNAVKKDLKKLKLATEKDKQNIADKSGLSLELINQAIEKLSESFIKNQNAETQSNQSKAQNEAYIKINSAMKIHKETKQLYIYALAVHKEVIQEAPEEIDSKTGKKKEVNSRPLTLAQNAVKKYFNFSTAKYRQFIVSPETLSGVNINGESFALN